MRPIAVLTCAGAVLAAVASAALAGPTQRACLTVERSPGPKVCACAQAVADVTLSSRDQKLAASIIREPDLFQKYRKDKSRRAQGFVERYRTWGARVEEACAKM